mgnify:CR=1 FL=1|jgi:glutamine amidotransferase
MIGIINYGMGNIRSVQNALTYLGYSVRIISAPVELDQVERIILPGVGAFGRAMDNLHSLGFVDALNEHVIERQKLFLGICLGMQLICRESDEFGRHQGLGWIDGRIERIPGDMNLRVPHVGWNSLSIRKSGGLMNGVAEQSDVYFVHGFYLPAHDQSFVSADCEYGQPVTAVIEQENIFATQFHPEKSQRVGLTILENFSRI